MNRCRSSLAAGGPTRRRRLPRLGAGLVVCGSLVLAGCHGSDEGRAGRPSPASSSTAAATAQPRITDATALTSREVDLTVDSPAVGDSVKVRLLLPAHYATRPAERWPVLYLLAGCCSSYASWTEYSDVARLSQGLDAIVAMPAGGDVGFYSDWFAGPKWETFHTKELPRLLADHYRAGSVAAIAGLSMGGLGALGYAARHPGMYAAAASFSGIVDTRLTASTPQWYLDLVSSEGENPLALWGDPRVDVATWKAHNPYDLAPRLKGVRLFVSSGNGRPGPLDQKGSDPDSTEAEIGQENRAFAKRLASLGLDATVDLYGPGTHSWAYWQRELHRAWPMLSRALGR